MLLKRTKFHKKNHKVGKNVSFIYTTIKGIGIMPLFNELFPLEMNIKILVIARPVNDA